jgi:hypothetical protein
MSERPFGLAALWACHPRGGGLRWIVLRVVRGEALDLLPELVALRLVVERREHLSERSVHGLTLLLATQRVPGGCSSQIDDDLHLRRHRDDLHGALPCVGIRSQVPQEASRGSGDHPDPGAAQHDDSVHPAAWPSKLKFGQKYSSLWHSRTRLRRRRMSHS